MRSPTTRPFRPRKARILKILVDPILSPATAAISPCFFSSQGQESKQEQWTSETTGGTADMYRNCCWMSPQTTQWAEPYLVWTRTMGKHHNASSENSASKSGQGPSRHAWISIGFMQAFFCPLVLLPCAHEKSEKLSHWYLWAEFLDPQSWVFEEKLSDIHF